MQKNNPSGMKASLKEVKRQEAEPLPAPSMALTINPRGYNYLKHYVKRARLPHKEDFHDEVSRMLQVCGVVYICFDIRSGAYD